MDKTNHILDYHRQILGANPAVGRELIQLNDKHIQEALGGLPEEAKKTMPTKAVRQLKKKKKKRK